MDMEDLVESRVQSRVPASWRRRYLRTTGESFFDS